MFSTRRLAAVVVATVVTTAACGGADDGPERQDPAAAASAALDEAEADASLESVGAGSTPTSTTPTTTMTSTTTSVPGIAVNENTLRIDECFNRDEGLSAGRARTITTLVDCDDPHGFQIFSNLQYPADGSYPYPGDDVMQDFALASCYQRFERWAGTMYETSELEIGVFAPTRETFEEQSYRRILCYVERADGEALIGTARGSGI